MVERAQQMRSTRGAATRRAMVQQAAAVSGVAGGVAALLSACGRDTGSAGQPAAVSPGPVSLDYLMPGWAPDAYKVMDERLVPSYRTTHPDVTAVAVQGGTSAELETRLRAQLAAGTPPDLVYLTFPHFRYADDKSFADLTRLVSKDNQFDLKNFYTRVVEYYRIPKGGLWALPHNYATEALYFNKTLLGAGGVKPPAEDWTWDDLVANGQRLRKAGASGTTDVWGVEVRLPRIDHILWDFGGGFLNDDGTKATIADPGSIQALQYVGEVITRYALQPYGDVLSAVQGGTRTLFVTGKLALQFRPEWAVVDYNKESALDYDVALVPKGPKGRFNFFFPGGVSITSGSKQPAAAYEFAKWFISDDSVIQQLIEDRGESPTAKIARNEYFWKQKLTKPSQRTLFLKNPDFAKIPFFLMPHGTELRDLVQPALNDLWGGKRAARDLAVELQPKMQAILDQK